MEDEEKGFNELFPEHPRRPLNVMLANPRESGVVEFLDAVRAGSLDEAKVIFEVKKIDPNVWLGHQGETALHTAAKNGYLDFVKYLIEAGANVNQKDGRLKVALHLASSGGHLGVVKALVEAGSCLDDIDKLGRSPLIWATAGRYVDVVQFLLTAGASITTSRNWHALHEACKAGYIELVKLLIDAGAPVNNPHQYSGCTPWSPLHIAVRHGNLDCVKLLISCGADVNSVNAGKHSPLHEAAYRGFEKITVELLLHGADPHAASNQKRTPLHEACMQGKVKTVMMLLDIGAKVNATDLVRDTPLHLALRADHAYDIAVQLTAILLQYGASPTLLGREDDMPLDIARQTCQGYCFELLEAALGEKIHLTFWEHSNNHHHHHAMVCQRGRFIIQHHNKLHDLEVEMLSMVCNDVEVEPVLQFTGETSNHGANKAPHAKSFYAWILFSMNCRIRKCLLDTIFYVFCFLRILILLCVLLSAFLN